MKAQLNKRDMCVALLRNLGPCWLARRAVHALKLRVGWFERRLPLRNWEDAPQFNWAAYRIPSGTPASPPDSCAQADAILAGRTRYFSRHTKQTGFPPDWFANPLSGKRTTSPPRHWSRESEFENGDIKGVWEQNRFSFVFPLVHTYQARKDERYADGFWRAIEDWREQNPPQLGPNWRCGQEVALRMVAWLVGLHAFADAKATSTERRNTLAQMVGVSAQRISANIGYALSQKNNHGVSEAAGLFVAGITLGDRHWRDRGKSLLERLAGELIYDDGSFSQHSTNYHRLALQLYLWAFLFGQANDVPLSDDACGRVSMAGEWLREMLDLETGRVPNLGSNDGALLFPTPGCDYLDFRPTVQAIGGALAGQRWLPAGPWDRLAEWLGIDLPEESSDAESSSARDFPIGGYSFLSHDNGTRTMFRCPPRFIHRPSHCDLLHVDVWINGVNVLRDGGSYSYNCDQPWQDYFPSVTAHNTVQFDGHDQMPKLNRFLYGRWPNVSRSFDGQAKTVEASFTDWQGARQQRRLERTSNGFRVADRVGGFTNEAVLRWRLAPEFDWTLEGMVCRSEQCCLSISTDGNDADISIAQGWESLYYQERTELPVLEVTVNPTTTRIITEISFIGRGLK